MDAPRALDGQSAHRTFFPNGSDNLFTHYRDFARLAAIRIQAEYIMSKRRTKTRGTASHKSNERTLTPRQKEILKLVSHGHTNREIASHLDISVRTVEVHRFNLMRRLRVRNVAQLLRQALIQGLLPKSFASR
jgi:DNA-binding NarL/FixJ family response regulator